MVAPSQLIDPCAFASRGTKDDPPDVIKLDRSIVDGVSSDPVLRSLVRSLVDFAEGCDARVVAEGVETAADAAVLCDVGVDYGQGWHYGRQGPAADLAAAAAIPVSALRHSRAHDDFTARSAHRDRSST